MKRVIVTGGAGFIGSHVCDYFLGQSWQVVALDDLSSGSESNLANGVQLEKLDIRSPQAADFIKEFAPDLVVHAAAQMSVSQSMKDPKFDADVNLLGLINILTAIQAAEHSTYLVFISTGGAIYGEQDIYPAPEDHPIFPTSFYGLSKHVGERYLDLWNRSYGLKYGILRLANVFGPRQNPHGEAGVVAIFNKLLLAGQTPVINGSGEQTRDYIFVADVVQAIAAVSKQQIVGTYNIGTGIETSVNSLYAQIVKELGIDCQPNYADARAGDQLRSSIDATKAQNELGWRCSKDLTQGLALTSQWFRNNSQSTKQA